MQWKPSVARWWSEFNCRHSDASLDRRGLLSLFIPPNVVSGQILTFHYNESIKFYEKHLFVSLNFVKVENILTDCVKIFKTTMLNIYVKSI